MVRKGFTLVELMIVILIVAILAAVAVPLMMNRVESAKWSEAKAAMGTIMTNVKAYYAEKGCNSSVTAPVICTGTVTGTNCVGVSTTDLAGTYFNSTDYTLSGCQCASGVVQGVVTCIGSQSDSPTGTLKLTLQADGQQVWDGPK